MQTMNKERKDTTEQTNQKNSFTVDMGDRGLSLVQPKILLKAMHRNERRPLQTIKNTGNAVSKDDLYVYTVRSRCKHLCTKGELLHFFPTGNIDAATDL